MLNFSDKNLLIEIIADAVAQAHLTCSNEELRNALINAVAEAAAVVLEGDTSFLHWDSLESILYCWSPDSNKIYQVTDRYCGLCALPQTPPTPCYHRALSRFTKNYFEFQQKPGAIAKIDFADAVFFDRELGVRQKIELLNLRILEGRIELKPLVQALEKHIIT